MQTFSINLNPGFRKPRWRNRSKSLGLHQIVVAPNLAHAVQEIQMIQVAHSLQCITTDLIYSEHIQATNLQAPYTKVKGVATLETIKEHDRFKPLDFKHVCDAVFAEIDAEY